VSSQPSTSADLHFTATDLSGSSPATLTAGTVFSFASCRARATKKYTLAPDLAKIKGVVLCVHTTEGRTAAVRVLDFSWTDADRRSDFASLTLELRAWG
jgi:hypothetical protein